MSNHHSNNNNIFDENIYRNIGDVNTSFRISASDSDSLFSTGSHHFDDEDNDHQTLLPLTHHDNDSSTSVFSFETIPMIPLSQTQARGPELQKKVSFWNGLGLVIGMMVGSGLFSSPGKQYDFVVSSMCIDIVYV